jgi:sugar lactone lactonase YvrE
LILDLKTGKLLRLREGTVSIVAEGFGGGDGLERAPDGTLYLTDNPGGRVFHVTLGAAGTRARVDKIAEVASAADLGLDSGRGLLLIPQLGENTVTVLKLP